MANLKLLLQLLSTGIETHVQSRQSTEELWMHLRNSDNNKQFIYIEALSFQLELNNKR
jgi:hypothetical protein